MAFASASRFMVIISEIATEVTVYIMGLHVVQEEMFQCVPTDCTHSHNKLQTMVAVRVAEYGEICFNTGTTHPLHSKLSLGVA